MTTVNACMDFERLLFICFRYPTPDGLMKLVTYECKWYASPFCYDSSGKATDSIDETCRIVFLHPSSRQSYEGAVDPTKIDDENDEKGTLEVDLTLSYFKNAAPIILEWLRRSRNIINKDLFAKKK